jgi:hypothetical protein
MDLRTFFYKHPYANMVTIVFLFSSLVTALYAVGLIPGVGTTEPGLARLTMITGILLVVTVAVWIVAISFGSADER